jgi:hypothetical protein
VDIHGGTRRVARDLVVANEKSRKQNCVGASQKSLTTPNSVPGRMGCTQYAMVLLGWLSLKHHIITGRDGFYGRGSSCGRRNSHLLGGL